MQNKKRKDFIQKIAIDLEDITRKRLEEGTENNRARIGDIVDAYKGFILDLGGGFLDIAESYNKCVQIAKNNKLIGNARLKARIKDFSSSNNNTDRKELDDVFGMELVTQTEFEKEVLMLFNHLAFDINRDNKYNKKTGYVAYHCLGDFLPKDGNIKDKIKQIVTESKTIEYRYSKTEQNKADLNNFVSIFPVLQEYISNPQNLNELSTTLEEMIESIKQTKLEKKDIPLIEFHFLTTEKEQEALYGTKANHSNYKKVNKALIVDKFNRGRLIRGINAPWKFVGGEEGLKLQDFYDTLLENWTFLKDRIADRRKAGKEKGDKEKTSKFDAITASQFPFLRKYLKEDYEYPEEKNAEKWGLLKTLIIVYRIDKSRKSQTIEEGLNKGIDKIWSK